MFLVIFERSLTDIDCL